jgi:hypothetical protein
MKRIKAILPVLVLRNIPGTAWAYLMMAALLIPSLVWILRDRSVWPWDQAWYGEVSVDLWFWLGHSLNRWWSEMINGLYLKPPGIVWLGQFFVPFRGIFGSVETALLFSILLTQFVVLALLFKIGQRMATQSRLIPLVGIVFAAGSQLFVGLSHQFFVEPLQALAVAWCFYIASRAGDWPKSRTAIHLASALLLGVLAKTTTPVYCLVPTLYCGYLLVRRRSEWDLKAEWKLRSSRALVLVFGILGIVCSVWYLRNLASVWQHVRDASSSDIALNYGTRDSVFHKLITWSGLINPSFLRPYLLWGSLAAILIGGGFAIYRLTKSSAQLRPDIQPLAVLSAIQIGLLLFIFSLNITVDSRYMYALLPGVVILFMQICMFVPRAALVALIVLGSAQWVTVNRYSFTRTDRLADQSNWLIPLQASSSQYEELRRVVRFTSDVGERYNIVGVQEPSLNDNSAAFFAAKERLKSGIRNYYTSLGYAEKDPDAAMRRIEELRTYYLITLSEQYQSTPPNFVNIVSRPVLGRVRRDPRFTQCPFPSEDGVVVFQFAPGSQTSKRSSPISSDGVWPTVSTSGVPPANSRAKVDTQDKPTQYEALDHGCVK